MELNTQSLILEDYKSKVLTKTILKKYNISYEKLRKLLDSNELYKKSNSLTYPESTITFIKENYMKMSNKDIANFLGINDNWLRVTASKLGLPKKGSGWAYTPELDNLDFNHKSVLYFLGWVCADGNVPKDLRSVSLSSTDKDIIELFLTIFPTAKVYMSNYNQKKPIYKLFIGSKTFVTKLINLGITPAKTKTLQIESSCINNHFIRGFFDGDGHVRNTLTTSGSKRYECGFVCASDIFTSQIVKYLNLFNIHCTLSKERTYNRVRISGKENVFNFYNFLYNDCDIWVLNRKKQILDRLFSNE